MIAAALIWPFMLLLLAVIGIVFSIGRLAIGQPASVVPAQNNDWRYLLTLPA